MTNSAQWARLWITQAAESVAENREHLIDLDRQIGDGDHGENLDRGFAAAVRGDALENAGNGADVLKHVAKTLMSTVGGAAGPLYGTAFLRGAQQLVEDQLTAAQVAALLEAAVGGVQARGKATLGEKTMVDALLPAAEAARKIADANGSAQEALRAAAEAARSGANATGPMQATKGRASYLGERSKGHLDPGAVSSALLIEAAASAADQLEGDLS